MYFKYICHFAVFLLCTVAAAAREPPADPTQPAPRSALPPDRKRLGGGLRGAAPRGGGRRFRASRSRGDAAGDAAGRMLEPAVTSATAEGVEARGGPRRALVSPAPPGDDCAEGRVEPVTPGRVYVSGQLEVTGPGGGYRADSMIPGQERVRGQRPGLPELWRRLQPAVECGDSAMTVTFRRRRASQVLLDRANESSVPLTRPPPRCGYSVQTTWRDLRLMARYDACHVTRKHDDYELPLLWRETPVKVSCPVPHIRSQSGGSLSVCCSVHTMSVKVQGAPSAELLRVNVRGQWTPLFELVEPCGFTLDEQDGEVTITAPVTTCGVAVMNGKYTLSIQLGDKKFMLACPLSTPEEPVLPPEVVVSIPDPPLETMKHSPESLKPFVWTPPFYLAPPLYPHPTYHNYHHPDRHGPSISSPPIPAPTFAPPSFPPVGSLFEHQDSYFYPDSLNEHVAHDSPSSVGDTESSGQVLGGQQAPMLGVFEQHRVTNSPSRYQVQVESPSLVPPTHTQYYRNYPHPKNPLPDAPQHAAPAPPSPSQVHHPDAAGQFNMDQSFDRRPGHTTHPQTVPSNERYPAHPHLDHHWYHFPENEAFNLPAIKPGLPTMRPPDWRGYEPLSDKAVEVPGPNADEASPPEPTSSPSTNILPPPFYPLPHHYQIYYGPERSLSGVSQMPSNDDPQLRTFGPQFSPLATEPKYDVGHAPLYHDAHPEASAVDQDGPHRRNMNTRSEPELLSDSAHGFPVWLAGHPSMLQASPSHHIYPHNIGEAYPDVDTPDELLDNNMGESTVQSRSELSDVTCMLQRLTSDPNTYVDECGIHQDVETLGLPMESPRQQDLGLEFLNPAGLTMEHGSPGQVRLRPAHRPARSTQTSVTTQLRIATDQTFTSFHPEARLPLSLVRGKPVYVEVSLLGPPEPGLVLLVHSCLACIETAYPSWMFVYDGCPSRSAAQLLPSPHSHHVRRIVIFSFLSPFSESPGSFNKRDFHPEDPEVLFLCLIGACSAVEGDCVEGCINSPDNV